MKRDKWFLNSPSKWNMLKGLKNIYDWYLILTFRRRFFSKIHVHYRHELVFFWRFSRPRGGKLNPGSIYHGVQNTIWHRYYTSFGWRNFFPQYSIWNTPVPLLSYSCMFQVKICSQQLEICKSMCMFIVLAIVVETD